MRFHLVLLFSFIFLLSNAQKYQGDQLLYILGQQRDSSETYKEFAKEWGLGKKVSAPDKGFKIAKNAENNRVTALLFAEKGYELNDVKFNQFTGTMPFGLSMTDDYNALRTKLGAPVSDGESVTKFVKNGLSVIATFKSSSKNKLSFIKITLKFGQTEYNPDGVVKETIAAKDETGKRETAKPSTGAPKYSDAKLQTMDETTPGNYTNTKPSKPAAALSSKTDLYKSLMQVMESGSESYFESIKTGAETPLHNFWNYKHTFATKVHIPGEQYNFIYAFPFPNSQKDFVVVLKEGAYEPEFKILYGDMLIKLKKDFPESEGWKYSFPKDENSTFPLKDFELQNPKFGSVILDYHQNPKNQSVLYLRMLLYYD